MRLSALLVHLFVPHPNNNHKAKLLHPISVAAVTVAFLAIQAATLFLPSFAPIALSYSSTITPEEIVELTNKKRLENGIDKLEIDESLTKAALTKASDMFARDYWAHNSPDGAEPWHFLVEAGYQYRFAGENLARDFSNSSEVVTAWMASPTHKENMLSPRYRDIGVAVVEGRLKGVQTALVVQVFGTRIGVGAAASEQKTEAGGLIESPVAGAGTKESLASKIVKLSPFSVKKNFAIFLVSVFVIVAAVDMFIIGEAGTSRGSSGTFAHFSFLLMVLIVVVVAKSGWVI